MSWPSTDFEAEIQTEIDALRDLERAVNAFLREKGTPNSVAFRNLKRAHEAYEEIEPADI